MISDPADSSSITLKYLESGYTFMSTDSFHAEVEGRMNKALNAYDFKDFMKCAAAPSVKLQYQR